MTQKLDDGSQSELDRTIMRPKPLASSTAPFAPVAPEEPASAQAQMPVPARSRTATRARDDRPRHGCLAALLWPIALVIFAFCVMRLLPLEASTGRFIPEAVSLVPWLIVPAGVIFLLALLWHRSALASLTCVMLALLVWWHAGFFLPSPARTAAAGGEELRVMTLNVYNGGADADEVVACVREQGVEVLALQEVSWTFLDELAAAGIYDALPHSASSSAGEWDNGGLNCLFSTLPLSNVDGDLLPTDLSALCAGTVEVGGRELRFVSVHPGSPHFGGEDLWDSGLETIGSLSEYDHSYVIMGDFNATWNHARFRALLGESFVDAGQQAGEGFHMTWPADLSVVSALNVPSSIAGHVPPLVEVDHVVYAANAGIYAHDLETARISGTDHLALIATLDVR